MFVLFSVYGCFAYMLCAPWIYVWCLQRPEKGVESPGTGVIVGCEPPLGCWELNLGLLEEQPVLLIAEPSPAPNRMFFSCL